VATGFPGDDQPGSRFGFRAGITKKAKEEYAEDQKAIRAAILGEGVNYNAPLDSPRRRVAWNVLPGLLSADVWREYVAKFTFDELFKPTQIIPPESEPQYRPTEQELEQLTKGVQVRAAPNKLEDGLVSILRELNKIMSRAIELVEGKKANKATTSAPPNSPTPKPEKKEEAQMRTALQVITEMVKDRLTKAEVKILGDHGEQGDGRIKSREFGLLSERGLSVINVSISNIRFEERIEEQLLSQWKAAWLKNAREEEERINRQISFAEIAGQETAELKYINTLSRQIINQRPGSIKEALQILLLRARLAIIRDNYLQRQMITEREDIENLLQWLENGP
jgi:hypothetical protein